MVKLKGIIHAVLFLVVMLIVVTNGHAAPSISTVSGTLSHGQTITISGSGFGATGPTILLWDDFEDGINGNSLNASPKIGSWLRGDNPSAIYSTTNARGGASLKSSRAAASSTDGNSGSQFQYRPLPTGTGKKFYMSFWWWMNFTEAMSSPINKYVQIHGTSGCWNAWGYTPELDTFKRPGLNELGNCAVLDGGSYQESYNILNVTLSKSRWMHHYLIIQQSAPDTANGYMGGYINLDPGNNTYTTISNLSNIKTRVASSCYYERALFFYAIMNATNVAWHIDDAYLSDGWNRVEIGDNATYANCKKREIQYPLSWGDTSVAITLNRGSFGASDTAYLFVVDNNNVASSGYQITIGGIVDNPPAPPTGLNIIKN